MTGAVAVVALTALFPQSRIFSSVTIILFAPREDAAFGTARNFMLGTGISAVFAAVIGFAVLPQTSTFAEFCVAGRR